VGLLTQLTIEGFQLLLGEFRVVLGSSADVYPDYPPIGIHSARSSLLVFLGGEHDLGTPIAVGLVPVGPPVGGQQGCPLIKVVLKRR
jgi:hypothetical protein